MGFYVAPYNEISFALLFSAYQRTICTSKHISYYTSVCRPLLLVAYRKRNFMVIKLNNVYICIFHSEISKIFSASNED